MALRLPNADLGGTLMGAEVAPLLDEHRQTILRRRAAQEERLAGEAAAPGARRADADAYADATRAGEKDPGPVNVAALEVKVKDAVRRVAGEDALLARVEGDITRLRQKQAAVWTADLTERRAALHVRAAELADALSAVMLDLQAVNSGIAWAQTGRPEVSKPTAILDALASVKALPSQNIEVVYGADNDATADLWPLPPGVGSRPLPVLPSHRPRPGGGEGPHPRPHRPRPGTAQEPEVQGASR